MTNLATKVWLLPSMAEKQRGFSGRAGVAFRIRSYWKEPRSLLLRARRPLVSPGLVGRNSKTSVPWQGRKERDLRRGREDKIPGHRTEGR